MLLVSSYNVLKHDSFISRMYIILILQDIKPQSAALQIFFSF